MKKALIIANVLLASSPVFGMNVNDESNNRTEQNSMPVSRIGFDRESNIQSARNVRRVSDSFFNSVKNGTREFNLEEYFRFRRELDDTFISALDSRIDRRSRPATSSPSSNPANNENIRGPFPTFKNDFNRSSSRDRETPSYLLWQRINRQSHTPESPFFSQSSSFSFDLDTNSRTGRRSRPATSSSSSNPANNDNIREPFPTFRNDFNRSSSRDRETPGYLLWQSINRQSHTSESPFFSQSSSFSFDLNTNSRTERRSRPATSSSSSNPANNDNIREPFPTFRDDFDFSSFLETPPGYSLWQSSPNRRSRTSEASSTSSSNDRDQTDFKTMMERAERVERELELELLRNSQQSQPQIKIKRDPITKELCFVSGGCSTKLQRMNCNYGLFLGIRVRNLKIDSSMTDDQIIQALRKAVDPNVSIIME